jgi:2-keto-3-deoxy-galactonokinase
MNAFMPIVTKAANESAVLREKLFQVRAVWVRQQVLLM